MILVTGSTGFVGQEVVAKLLALDLPVRLLVRNPKRASQWADHKRVEIVLGDALKTETLPAAMKGVQAVIHLVGIIAETSRVTYEEAHRDATRYLLAAAKEAGVTRWVQMSALGTRPQATSRYHQTKWAAEELVRSSGLDWTIFRPSLIYGYDKRDRLLNMLRLVLSPPLNFVQLFSLPLLNGGQSKIQPVSVREVAHCFALAPSKESSIGRTFDLVGPAAFTWREMIFKVLRALGKKGAYEQIPLLVVVRGLLWLVVAIAPFYITVETAQGVIPATWTEIAAGLWVVFFVVAVRWRCVIVFSLPGQPLLRASEWLNGFAPRELRPSEMLKMAVEDNVGDAKPAMEIFAYQPETFEEGLAKIYR